MKQTFVDQCAYVLMEVRVGQREEREAVQVVEVVFTTDGRQKIARHVGFISGGSHKPKGK